jgi:hypothetical protein
VIDGMEYEKTDKFLIATISELSEGLKDVIRDSFSAICHGEQNSLTGRGNYTYKRTVEEFLIRIKSKSSRVQTGMLGELMVHVLTGIVYPGYKTIVPYFNLEERNIKKGFDSVIYSLDIGIWAYEVKSSKPRDFNGNVDSKIKNLIQVAHNDLSGKLEQQDEVSRLWGSAMSGFRVACGHLDEKAALEEIILDYQDGARTPECGPENHNVILSSVLISGEEELGISSECVADRHAEYVGTYNELMIFAVHKSILVDLLEFFEQEVTNEVA